MHSRRLGQNPFIPQNQKLIDATNANTTTHFRRQLLLSDYTCSVLFFQEKVLLSGTHTEFPSQTNIWLPVFESSQLAHILFFTVGITCLYHESFFLQGISQREYSSRSAGIFKLYSESCSQERKTNFRTISYTVFRTWTSTTVQP